MAFPPLAEILPHRPPMLLLDAMTAIEVQSVTCSATVRAGAPFVAGGRASSLLAVEYFAQAVAAMFAYKARGGDAGPFRGLLLGVRDLELEVSHLRVGDELLGGLSGAHFEPPGQSPSMILLWARTALSTAACIMLASPFDQVAMYPGLNASTCSRLAPRARMVKKAQASASVSIRPRCLRYSL